VTREKELRLGSFKHGISITHTGKCKVSANFAREALNLGVHTSIIEEAARCHQ